MKVHPIVLCSIVALAAPFTEAQEVQSTPGPRRHVQNADRADAPPAARPVVSHSRPPQSAVALPRNSGALTTLRTPFNAPNRFDRGPGNNPYRQIPPRPRSLANPTAERPDGFVAGRAPRRPSIATTDVASPAAGPTTLPRSGAIDWRRRHGATGDRNSQTPTSLAPTAGGAEQPSTNAADTTSRDGSGGRDWRNRNGSDGNYADAWRRYHHDHHDRNWWRNHCDRIILISGGYYYWDTGYWYPAWGYDPAYSSYAYDGPIYGYDGLPPDEVISSVQAALQEEGYYLGAIDGELGPLTRQAISAWQRDHGLAITTAIDEPTMRSLGLR